MELNIVVHRALIGGAAAAELALDVADEAEDNESWGGESTWVS